MRLPSILASLLILALPAAAGARGPGRTEALPASLDRLYPPRAEAPRYHLAMLELGHAMTRIVADLVQGDIVGARANFPRFQETWNRTADLVPEWKSRFPATAVRGLGKALEGDSPGPALGAIEPLGRACHDCHVASMGRAQHRYHWSDFREIDAFFEGEPAVSFPMLMQRLDVAMTGIGNDLEQGQQDRAIAQAKTFSTAFRVMAQTCDSCHDSERHYYVDGETLAVLDRLEETVRASPADPGAVGALVQQVGVRSCVPCHRVHVPAALSKHR